MTESDLVAALRPVAAALDALGVRYYLGGSVASSAHGIARASLDADVVAFFRSQGRGYQTRINDELRKIVAKGLTASSKRTQKRPA